MCWAHQHPRRGESLAMMCGFALVCSDPPRCLGLQDKHNTHRGLRRKWSRASPWRWSTADLPWSSHAVNDVSHHLSYPSYSSLWRNSLFHTGEFRLRQSHRRVCTIPTCGLGGVQKTGSAEVSWGWICKACNVFEQPWCQEPGYWSNTLLCVRIYAI